MNGKPPGRNAAPSWWNCSLLRVLATRPAKPARVQWKVIEEGTAFDGKAQRKQIRVTLSTDAAAVPIDLLLYSPAGKSTPSTTYLV